jgi:serine/threonine protein kinase
MEELRRGDPEVVGPYRVVGRLGSGAMGQVFLAQAGGLPVALKVIQPGLAEERQFRDRFRREVHAARRVTGPHTAAVMDADPDGDPPWMATEYVAGPTLQQLVEDEGPMPIARVKQLGAEIAGALTQMHAVGVVHRDLKPTNVLVPPGQPARVIDFGIARVADATSATATGLAPGSAGYMSPEQASLAAKVGPEADIFALGAMLHFASTGELVFGSGPAPVVMYRVVHEEPDLSAVADPALRSLIAACLAKPPEQRPSPEAVRAACSGVPTPWNAGANWAPGAASPMPTQLHARQSAQTAESSVTGPSTEHGVPRRRVLLVAGATVVTLALAGAAGAWLLDRPTAVPYPVPSATSTAGPTSNSPQASTASSTPSPSPSQTSSASASSPAPVPQPTTAAPPPDTNPEDPPATTTDRVKIVRNADDKPCQNTGEAGNWGPYPIAICNFWQTPRGLVTRERVGKGPKKVTCQRNLGRKNHEYLPRETNTWWVWTTSKSGLWDWFPETALKEGAPDQPINGIALCR